jgi:hypothetical protein
MPWPLHLCVRASHETQSFLHARCTVDLEVLTPEVEAAATLSPTTPTGSVVRCTRYELMLPRPTIDMKALDAGHTCGK